MPEWDAEVAIDGELVRALLRAQFPELDASSARLVGEGWDNSVWLVEEQWAFRFPRRQIAIPGVERELALLPRLAPLLPIPIPEPRFVGAASERFLWPFFAAQLLPGQELADAELAEDARVEVGAELGRFLRVLHAPETAARVDPEGASRSTSTGAPTWLSGYLVRASGSRSSDGRRRRRSPSCWHGPRHSPRARATSWSTAISISDTSSSTAPR